MKICFLCELSRQSAFYHLQLGVLLQCNDVPLKEHKLCKANGQAKRAFSTGLLLTFPGEPLSLVRQNGRTPTFATSA